MTERSEVREPALLVEPIGHPVDAMVSVPGSKSLTNRALLCAALAEGTSTIDNALVADDSAGHARRPSPPSALASRWTMGTRWPPGPS